MHERKDGGITMSGRWRMVHGKTHSWNALAAEYRGEMPLTRAVNAVYAALDCKSHGVSRRKVREYLEQNCRRGWHHVAGPNGLREVPYYATALTDEEKRALLGDAECNPPP